MLRRHAAIDRTRFAVTASMILATVLAATTAAGAVSAAPAATLVPRACGTITIAGKPWTVISAGVPCSSARTLIRKLAASKPAPKPYPSFRSYPGTYLGMKCNWASKNGRTGVTCASTNGKLVEAFVRR